MYSYFLHFLPKCTIRTNIWFKPTNLNVLCFVALETFLLTFYFFNMYIIRLQLIIFLATFLFFACDNSTKPVNGNNDIDDTTVQEFVFGSDLSYVNQIEDKGGVFKINTTATDPFAIFKQKGNNMVRLRLWHNPNWVYDIYGQNSELYSGFADVAKSIKRAKDNDMAVNLDFHYSDTWADPEKQHVPQAWKNITSIDVLCDSVYNYTYNVLLKLHNQNLLPQMVQIGNETNCGMLLTQKLAGFPNLSVCDGNWLNAGKVFNAGIKAVRDIDKIAKCTTQIALHVADPKNIDWWFNNIINSGKVTDFDIIGFSYYPLWHTAITYDALPALVQSVKAKFKRKIMILETAYPYTTQNADTYGNLFGQQTPLPGFAYTPEGQKQFLIDLTQRMVNAGADGIMYWEPAWITSQMRDLWGTGSAWENCAFFNFSGNATVAFDYMQHNYTE